MFARELKQWFWACSDDFSFEEPKKAPGVQIYLLAFPPFCCYNCRDTQESAYSSADRAPASGAGSAGSSPARRTKYLAL